VVRVILHPNCLARFRVNLQPLKPLTTTASGSKAAKRQTPDYLVKNAAVLLALAIFTFLFSDNFLQRFKGTDFPEFYAAARLVKEGRGRQLYNVAEQDRAQIRYAGRIGTYYNHPPFETLIYLPFCLASLRSAYLLWCAFNAGLLAYTAIVMQRHKFLQLDWRALTLSLFLFPPVLLNFLQGQDSIVLLLLMTLSVRELKRNRDFAAGCWLGFGLFKFHIILTFVALAASLGRKRILGGVALMVAVLMFVSAAISGWGFLTAYPRFLMEIRDMPLAGIHSAQMANIRGLIGVSQIVHDPVAQSALTVLLSAILLCYSWMAVRKMQSNYPGNASLAFAIFALVAILVSYHLSPHDLCIILLALVLISSHLAFRSDISRSTKITTIVIMGLVFLPPLHLILLSYHLYALFSLSILALLVNAQWLMIRNPAKV
jgi:Glycosyltransferase family 87